jgi:hypothetical protein
MTIPGNEYKTIGGMFEWTRGNFLDIEDHNTPNEMSGRD